MQFDGTQQLTSIVYSTVLYYTGTIVDKSY